MLNILMIHTHDTGKYNSVYGIDTPTNHLKKFAQEALTCHDVFSVAPTCSPSRGAMLTGRYPHNNGLVGLAHRGFCLDKPEHHLANFLKRNGYHTILAGVQHEQGFWLPQVVSEKAAKTLGYETNLTDFTVLVRNGDDYMTWDCRNAEKVAACITNYCDKRPFFLSYGLFSTHRQYPSLSDNNDLLERTAAHVRVPQTLYDDCQNRQDTARLHESLRCFDDNFRKVIEALKAKGLYDETIILYTTDHGLANPFAKANVNDAGTRVSFVLRSPKHRLTHGKQSDALISQLDWFPTLCQLVGLDLPDYLEGISFSRLLDNPHRQHRQALFGEQHFHTSYEPVRSIRTKRYRLIEYLDEQWDYYNLSNCDESYAKKMLIDNGWQHHKKRKHQLYDLYFDPLEANNLAENKEYQAICQQLAQQLASWRRKTGDRVWTKADYAGRYQVNKRESVCPTIRTEADLEKE